MRQAQLAAGETDVDELVFWQVELSHHRLPIGTTKAQPLLLCLPRWLGNSSALAATATASKTHFADSSYRPNNTIHAFNSKLSNQTEVAPNDLLISSDSLGAVALTHPTARGTRYNAGMQGETICSYFIALSVSLLRRGPLNLIPTGRQT